MKKKYDDKSTIAFNEIEQNDIERKVLGTMSLDPKQLKRLGISRKYFYIEQNRQIYDAMLECYDEDAQALNLAKMQECLGTYLFDYFIEIMDSTVSTTQLDYYIEDLSERYVINESGRLYEQLKNGVFGHDEYIRQLKELQEQSISAYKEKVLDAQTVCDMITSGENILEFTDYKGIGKAIQFQEETLNIIGARPSVGKSAFALNLLNDLSKNPKYKCIYFNLEMTPREICERLVAMNTRTKMIDLRNAPENSQTRALIKNTWEDILSRNITIISKPTYIENVSSLILREQKKDINKDKHIIVFIDYLGYLQTNAYYQNDRERLGQMVRDLHAIIKDRHCTLFLLAQINRDAVDKRNKVTKPTLENLKDTGELEQTGHCVILLNDNTKNKIVQNKLDHSSDDDYTPMQDPDTHEMELIVAKNRSGRTGDILTKFHRATCLFTEIYTNR